MNIKDLKAALFCSVFLPVFIAVYSFFVALYMGEDFNISEQNPIELLVFVPLALIIYSIPCFIISMLFGPVTRMLLDMFRLRYSLCGALSGFLVSYFLLFILGIMNEDNPEGFIALTVICGTISGGVYIFIYNVLTRREKKANSEK